MESSICGICLDKDRPLKLVKTLFTKEISNILQKCCDFLFQNGDCLVDNICDNCWKSIKQFDEFCDSVRNVHGFSQVYVESTKEGTIDTIDEPIEYVKEEDIDETVDENIEESIEDISAEYPIKSILSIEKDVDKNSALARRPVAMTPKVIKALEKQLQPGITKIHFDDLDFDKVSRFVNMDCIECAIQFQSFDEVHSHCLDKHFRPATWVCCRIELESAYDIYDHIKYHERIDDYRCAACFKCFLTSNKLKFHIRRNHLPIENDSYICSIKSCKKDCKNQRLLLNHHKSHIIVDCPYCTEPISAVNYMVHVRTHTRLVSEKGRSSNEKDKANKKPSRPSPVSRTKKLSGVKRVKPKVTHKKVPKPSTILTKKTLTLSFVQNDESGVVYCDICNMKFDRMSRVLIHRNKVHV